MIGCTQSTHATLSRLDISLLHSLQSVLFLQHNCHSSFPLHILLLYSLFLPHRFVSSLPMVSTQSKLDKALH